jgi:hypothetical protein
MAHFYRKLLEESEQKHEETVAATQSTSKTVKGPQGATPNLTIVRPAQLTPKSDAELARLAREEGKDVELNEDNQIVDKRDLLSAGLNLSAPNTRRIGLHAPKNADADAPPVDVHQAVGSAASRKEINERRMQEISAQLAEEQERVVKEKERQESEAAARLIARRNNDADIQKALERYQERKRRKLEKPSEEMEE